jgi:hypothetical protein
MLTEVYEDEDYPIPDAPPIQGFMQDRGLRNKELETVLGREGRLQKPSAASAIRANSGLRSWRISSASLQRFSSYSIKLYMDQFGRGVITPALKFQPPSVFRT